MINNFKISGIEVNSGNILERRSHYSPRLKRTVILVYYTKEKIFVVYKTRTTVYDLVIIIRSCLVMTRLRSKAFVVVFYTTKI